MRSLPIKLMIISGIFALFLSLILVPTLKASDRKDSDVLAQVLGGTAGLAADAAFKEADIYFHRGADVSCPDKNHDNQDAECHHEGCKAEAEHQSADLPLMGMIKRLHGEAAPKEHRELEGREEAELLPWFVATVKLNPHHIEAWRDGTYWYYRMGNTREAVDFISQGILANPNDYRVYMERGILYHRLGKWPESVRDLERAKTLWKNNSEDAPYDARGIASYLKNARSRSKTGHRPEDQHVELTRR